MKQQTPTQAVEAEKKAEQIEEKLEEVEEEEISETGEKLAYPMATVVRNLKKNCDSKMISSKVKTAMNQFLGDMTTVIAKDMAQTRYSMVEMDDFQRATKPYTVAKEFEVEKERVLKELEKMRSNIEAMIREFQRKFAIKSADDTHVLDTTQP